jgi:hypothetical protein
MAAFHYLNFIGGEAVKVIDEAVNLRVRGGDLAFEVCFFLGRFGDGHALVQSKHSLDEVQYLLGRRELISRIDLRRPIHTKEIGW